MIIWIFLIAALVLAILAAFNVSGGRFALGWAALACYFASLIANRL